MTIISAVFANPDHTSAICVTDSDPSVAIDSLNPLWSDVLTANPTPYTPPALSPDWVAFRRDLLASEVYTAIKLANFTPTTYHLPGELSAALVVDPPNCPIVCGLWNQLIRPLTNGQIEWIRTAIAAHHIPLAIDNNGVLTHADI